jgi:beta-xylosidase
LGALGFVLAAVLAVTGCVYQTSNGGVVADPGVLPYGGKYLIASTGGSTMPVYSITPAALKDPQNGRVTPEGQIFTAGQLTSSWIDTTCGKQCGLWAPEIKKFGNTYVAYFSARKKGGPRCIGMATSASPTGGYSLAGSGFCSPKGYDLIDPSVFADTGTGRFYLLFKRDVPAAQQATYGPKSIAITSLDSSGLHPSLSTTRIATPSDKPGNLPDASWETMGGTSPDSCSDPGADGWESIEAPTMIRRTGWYYLFYSANGYCTDHYGVGVGRCPTSYVNNDPTQCDFDSYTKRNQGWKDPVNPIITAEYDTGHCGAGHQDLTDNASLIWYHTYPSQISKSQLCAGSRELGAQRLSWVDDPNNPFYGWPIAADHRSP